MALSIVGGYGQPKNNLPTRFLGWTSRSKLKMETQVVNARNACDSFVV